MDSLGISALTARDTLLDGNQGPLPSDQWMLEVEHWHDISMAQLQRVAVELATGPSDPATLNITWHPTDAGDVLVANVLKSQVSKLTFTTSCLHLRKAALFLLYKSNGHSVKRHTQ